MSRIPKPIDVPTRETAEFIAAHVAPGSSILEIGCGNGDVGAELTRRRFEVTGIDADPEAVNSARSLGVNTFEGRWPDVEIGSFEAVVFTRSLHHIENLDAAIAKAADVLPDNGIIILEDFAFNVTDQRTLDWFLDLIRSEPFGSLIIHQPDEFATRMLKSADPMYEWKHDQHHDLHSAEAMRNAIAQKFDVIYETESPYFYRYFVPVFPESVGAARLVDQVLADEKRLGASHRIALIGRRILGEMKSSN